HLHNVLNYVQKPTTNKPIRLKNKLTGDILEFENRKKCARYFNYTPSHLARLTNGKLKWDSSRLKKYKIIE
ncbi:MAG TPA: hypothetical protein VFC79_03260, partial [Tissierellaceae bacterium]|nr:hypothetical protein [Tissierellaceae bacterium]